MIYNLRRVEEREMLRNWAIAEVASIRRQKYLTEVLSQDLLQKIQRGEYQFTESEWQQLGEMIRSTRAELLDGLVDLGMAWYEGELPSDEVKDLKMMNWAPFVTLAGSREFIDLVQALRQAECRPIITNSQQIYKESGAALR